MRMAFGLIAILGFLIAVVLFWSQAYLPYTQQVVTQGQSAQTTAERLAGVDTGLGGRVAEHVAFQPVEPGGKLQGLRVTSLNTGSSFQSHYGIQVGDVIDTIGPQRVRDIGDVEMAKSLALEAYQRSWELGITRNGRHYNMPTDLAAAGASSGPRVIKPTAAPPLTPTGTPAQPGQPAASAQPAPGTQQPAQPRPQQDGPGLTPLQRQMDAIMNFKNDEAGK